jgi:plastocyanin
MSAPAGGPGLPPSPDDWDGARVDVSAIDNTFRPQTVEVAAGTMVVWTNGGRNEHDVIAVDGTWGIALEEFPPDAVYGHVFTEPGEHPYYCTIHGTTTVGMVGTIVVTA